jgi:hypothetical protein
VSVSSEEWPMGQFSPNLSRPAKFQNDRTDDSQSCTYGFIENSRSRNPQINPSIKVIGYPLEICLPTIYSFPAIQRGEEWAWDLTVNPLTLLRASQ